MKKRTVLVVCVVLAVILVALSYEGIRGWYQRVTEENREWAEYQQKKKDGQWVAERLGEVQRWKYPTPPEGVYLTLTRVTENAVVAVMHNDTEESWSYANDGSGHMLQVKLGDAWYFVPRVPGPAMSFVLIGTSASFLDPGQAVEQNYGFGWWGELPAGTYRMMVKIHQVKNAGTAEHRVIDTYPTVEFEIP